MPSETGISLYFRDDRIRIRSKTMSDLRFPKYIHLLIDEKKKLLYIQKCDRDLDAFRVYYARQGEERYLINAKVLMKYLAGVIGVSEQSASLRFNGELLPDSRTILVDLKEYTEIPYEGTR